MKVFLLGGTDLSLAIASALIERGIALSGVVHLGKSFAISYNKSGVQNHRYADMASWCEANSVPHLQFDGTADIEAFARKTGGDFLLAAGWYHLVPAKLRDLFKKGAAGLHASLLPKLRGGAPLPWAILSGADKTGVSMFALNDEIDAGELYGQKEIVIGDRTTSTELVREVELASVALATECIAAIANGTMKMRPQSGSPSFCLQRVPDDGRVDWRQPASRIDRLVRAVAKPYPGAFSEFEGRRLTIWKAELFSGVPVHGMPGQIARLPDESDPIVVAGEGCIVVRSAEIDGQDAMPLLRKSSNKRFAPW